MKGRLLFRAIRLGLLGAALHFAGIPAATAQPIEGANPAVWSGDVAGPLMHKPTGASFPPSYGIFHRSRVLALTPDGSDVALNYDAQDGDTRTRLSIFLYRPRDPAQHGLKGALAAIAARSPKAFIWADGPFAIPAPSASPVALRAFKGAYKTGIGPQTVMDYLYLAELGAWTVKVRATITHVRDPSQEEAIDLIVRQLPWGTILDANGPCQGPACRTTGAMPFDSHMVESMLPAVLAKRLPFDPAAERSLPEIAQAPVPPLGAVAIRQSRKPPLLYVAEVKDLGTFRAVRLPDNLSGMIDSAFGKLSIAGPVYAVTIQSEPPSGAKPGGAEPSLLIPRFFAGEPTPAQFGAAVGEFVLHSTASPFVTVAETVAAMDAEP